MSRPKLTYFDFPGGRGEECRLALHVAGVEFDDDRLRDGWKDLKPKTPFGGLPVLTVPGKGELAQSNTILRFVGRMHDLHPSDPWTAARHDELMDAVEDLRHSSREILRVEGDERVPTRQRWAEGALQRWAASVDQRIDPRGPFVAGDTLHVADLKLFVICKWFVSGGIDHVPPDVLKAHERLMGVYEAVEAHPRVVDWYAR